MTEAPAAPAARPPSRVTLANCWTFVAVSATTLAILQAVEVAYHSGETTDGEVKLTNCLVAVLFALVAAVWVTLDCRRRDVAVGWWRWVAILFGPLGLAVYLVAAYRVRGLAYVVVMVGLYFLTLVPALLLEYHLYGDFAIF